jgi:ABC-2 type transport system ATP-binding protein
MHEKTSSPGSSPSPSPPTEPPESEGGREYAVDLHDVRKSYKGKVHALRGIEMKAQRGEIFGLLGPNGAGKSTLVKIMLTVVRPTRARGTILGRPIGHQATLRRVGYLPEKHRFPIYQTGRQAIEFVGAMSQVDAKTCRNKADELLDLVGMADWGDKKVSTYSKGMLQRVGIAAAMVNDPDLVVLDEPTDGVDPVGRKDIRDVLVKIRDRGACVFLNSHLLSELEMVCDRVAILVQGEVAAQGTIEELTSASRRYEITIAGSPPDWTDRNGLSLTSLPGQLDGTSTLVLPTAEADLIQDILDQLRRENRTIVSLRPVRESLEDLFIRYVHDPETGRAKAPGAIRNVRASKGGDA